MGGGEAEGKRSKVFSLVGSHVEIPESNDISKSAKLVQHL